MSTGLNHSTFIADMITSLLYKRYTCSLNACYSTLYDGTINEFEIYLEISLYPAILAKFFSALQDLSNLWHMLETP